MLKRLRYAVLPAAAVLLLAVPAAGAEPCSRDTLRKVVDEAGARLRVLTAETQPRVVAGMRRLKERRGWTGPDADEKAAALMSDARTAELDAKSAQLLARIDELGETSSTGGAEPDCSRLAELEATSLELQATVRAKSQHVLALLDRAAGEGGTTAQPAPAQQPPRSAAAPPSAPPVKATPAPGPAPASPPPAPAPKAEAPPPRKEALAVPPRETPQPKTKPAAPSSWSTETVDRGSLPATSSFPPGTAPPPPLPPPPPSRLPPLPDPQQSEGFSREEIAEASRGFFGTISGGLGAVFEHAFSTLGRPTGYVLGNEGGGAFIAGVRYGSGTLYLRDGSKRDVYWHGPSIGYDFGASGSKTLFLVYNLRNELDIFSGYSGIDGSAYLVGGVGMTVLTDGKIVMAPIRSGIGVRLGANVGYIRFTARPTWNPF